MARICCTGRSKKHFLIEKEGVEGKLVLRGGFDERAEEKGVGGLDRIEELAGIEYGTGGDGESEEFGEEWEGVV